ncbi:uncharacterized protein LOC123517934 [Portunus trituberculatus]|uniref:uncharacterized protein LOC123517934 n=1 Tax=Portunus trituberculatus TaxID=210409 RepID=UPI001E1CE1BC|nr:uncharacterized protein LOC123517934 [Portunus trituberculatus]XP_045134334.1 uncharacterized protein LOC123517934 [Portunus trituberculatus]
MSSIYPDPETIGRCYAIKRIVERAFGLICLHMSRLNDRTIREYCKDEEIPRFIVNFFDDVERELIHTSGFLEFEMKLSFKFLKTCCGLKGPRDKCWNPNLGSAEEKDTFEYLIAYCWDIYVHILSETQTMPDEIVDDHLDKVLKALLLLIEKVEREREVTMIALKSDISKLFEKTLDSCDICSCFQHMYIILSEHLVHQIFVMVYNHLNQLHGMSLSKFLNRKKMNLVPRTGFSNEQEFLKRNPSPEKMPVRILYQVIKRVCFHYEKRRITPKEELLQILHEIKEEYKTPVRNEKECVDKCYRLFRMLEDAFDKLCRKTGKKMEVIIGKVATKTLAAEHIQKPCELPDLSISIKSDSPLESSASSTTSFRVHRSPSTNNSGLTIEEVNVCVLHKVIRPGGLASRTLAMIFKALGGEFAKIKDNGKVMRNWFKDDEKKFIEENLNDDLTSLAQKISQKDITLLCKLLRYGSSLLSAEECDWSLKSNNKYTIEYNITVIKNVRNTFAHEVISINTKDLDKKLDILRESLHTIIEKAKTLLEYHNCDMISELEKYQTIMESELQEIYKISQHLSVNNVWKELIKMRDEVIETAQQELMQPHLYGESIQNMSPITGSTDSRLNALTMEKVFMERQLEDKNDINAGIKGTYKLEDILFSHDSILDSYRVFIIHAKPGDGKTSICKYLFHLWSQDIAASSHKGVELLFYIPCRYVTIKSLSAYLKGKLPKAFGNTKNEDIIPILQEPQVLFVMDGYDEAGEEAKCLINEILTSLPDSRMIITTKTQWAPKIIEKVKTVTFDYKVLRVAEMTKEMERQCVKKLFNAMKQDTEDCNDFLRNLDEMKENLNILTHVPLTLTLLALLWIEEPKRTKKIRTLAELFQKLTALIIKRVAAQLHMDDTFNLHDWMIKLGEIAWNNLKNKKHHLGEQDLIYLNRVASKLDLGKEGYNHMMSSLLYCEIHENLLNDIEKKWTFTVTSQQEYFVAEYAVDELCHEKKSLKSILELSEKVDEKYKKQLQRLIPVIELICGLLAFYDKITDNIKEITEIMSIKESWSFISLDNMFRYLIGESPQVKHVVKSMFKNEKLGTIDNCDPQSILWVLNNTSLDVEEEVTVCSTVDDLWKLSPYWTIYGLDHAR